MFKFIFKNRNREGTPDECLAPETRPIIYNDLRTIIIEETPEAPAERIHYKLIRKKRRERMHNLH